MALQLQNVTPVVQLREYNGPWCQGNITDREIDNLWRTFFLKQMRYRYAKIFKNFEIIIKM